MTPTHRQADSRRSPSTSTFACLLLLIMGGAGCSRQQDDATAVPSTNAADPGASTPAATAATDGHLRAERAWVRATPPNAPVAGGYVTLRNGGMTGDRLLSIDSPDAARVEVHEMRMAAGAMQMRALPDGVPVAAGAAVELKPGGIHLMFIGPTHPYVAGATVEATLVFASAPAQTLAFTVQPLGAMTAPAGVHDARGN